MYNAVNIEDCSFFTFTCAVAKVHRTDSADIFILLNWLLII